MNHCVCCCLIPLAESCTYCIRAPGKLAVPETCLLCQQRNLSPSPPILWVILFSQVEKGQRTCVSACVFSEKTGYNISLSLTLSSIHLSLLASSWSSVTNLGNSSAWMHLPQLYSLLPGTGVRVGHTLQHAEVRLQMDVVESNRLRIFASIPLNCRNRLCVLGKHF